MIIQFLNGGLANQVYQYIFYRFLQLSRQGDGSDIFLDDSYFYVNHIHNGYELERVFGLHPNLLSRVFDADVWEEMLAAKRAGDSIPQTFLNMGENIAMFTEASNCKQHNPFRGQVYWAEGSNLYTPELAGVDGNWYIHGYWLNSAYFRAYEDILRRELCFPEITDSRNLAYLDRILNEDSFSVHVRRGDFVQAGLSLAESEYRTVIQAVVEERPNVTIVLFSDDLDWCRAHKEALGLTLTDKVLYIEGNRGKESYRDLQLMSNCRGMLVANSSFNCLAAMLNRRREYLINLSIMEL